MSLQFTSSKAVHGFYKKKTGNFKLIKLSISKEKIILLFVPVCGDVSRQNDEYRGGQYLNSQMSGTYTKLWSVVAKVQVQEIWVKHNEETLNHRCLPHRNWDNHSLNPIRNISQSVWTHVYSLHYFSPYGPESSDRNWQPINLWNKQHNLLPPFPPVEKWEAPLIMRRVP